MYQDRFNSHGSHDGPDCISNEEFRTRQQWLPSDRRCTPEAIHDVNANNAAIQKGWKGYEVMYRAGMSMMADQMQMLGIEDCEQRVRAFEVPMSR
jgi:hypothetical protein